MPASGAARREAYVADVAAGVDAAVATPWRTLAAVGWAIAGSTLQRVRRGEGALLAINLSLIAYQGGTAGTMVAQGVVSLLAIAVMYAFNDLYDAPLDWKNPKKDRALIATWIEHRGAGMVAIAALKLVTLGVALATLGPLAAAAAAGVMVVNVVYSMALKGVPVLDITWVWLWGALYAQIVEPSAVVLVVVGLMTAVCHLFQALDDRVPDAANGIRTTAVRSAALSRNVLIVLSVLLCAVLRPALGATAALTAFTPLAIFFVSRNAGTGWLLTKAYFALMWLYLLGNTGAGG
jgi:4-hydroxybenzoate polyprenyltransferase